MFLEDHVFNCLLLCITPTFSSLKNNTHLLSHNVIVSGIQVQLNWVLLLSVSQKAAKCQLGLHHLNVELGEDLLLRSLLWQDTVPPRLLDWESSVYCLLLARECPPLLAIWASP